MGRSEMAVLETTEVPLVGCAYTGTKPERGLVPACCRTRSASAGGPASINRNGPTSPSNSTTPYPIPHPGYFRQYKGEALRTDTHPFGLHRPRYSCIREDTLLQILLPAASSSLRPGRGDNRPTRGHPSLMRCAAKDKSRRFTLISQPEARGSYSLLSAYSAASLMFDLSSMSITAFHQPPFSRLNRS